jgi:hypothetical protein
MEAVQRRPNQAVSRLPPSPSNEHPTSARNRERGPVTDQHEDAGPRTGELIGQLVGIFLIATYGGYFGAAAGVLLLELLLHNTCRDPARANAAKNELLGIANTVAAVAFVFLAPDGSTGPPSSRWAWAAWSGPGSGRWSSEGPTLWCCV